MSQIGFKTLLCAVDFSETSKKSFEYAKVLAQKFDSKIILLHVVEPLLTGTYVTFEPTLGTQVMNTMEEKAEELLKELKGEDKNIEIKIIHGTAYEEIVEYAKKVKADLIVMGTHGLSGLSHFLIGSVAEKVVRKAGCPVLTVKMDE
ncbi:MAG: universal stress protein [Planctomycetota bacterium]|nr:MAG: universal stress protein [Planctomycetota bacterium]